MADGETPTDPTIRLEISDAIATITLDRPAALNALTVPMKQELLLALQRAEGDRAVRAVVLTVDETEACLVRHGWPCLTTARR